MMRNQKLMVYRMYETLLTGVKMQGNHGNFDVNNIHKIVDKWKVH